MKDTWIAVQIFSTAALPMYLLFLSPHKVTMADTTQTVYVRYSTTRHHRVAVLPVAWLAVGPAGVVPCLPEHQAVGTTISSRTASTTTGRA